MRFLHWCITLILFFARPSVWAFENNIAFEKDTTPTKILLFLSRSCPCSRSHIEHLNQLQKKYKNTVHLYGVITDAFDSDSTPYLQEYYSDKNFSFPIIKDESQILVKKYNALKTPHTVVLHANTNAPYKIVYQGGVTNRRDFHKSTIHFLEENLSLMTQGKTAKYSEGKSLGCYIRRL